MSETGDITLDEKPYRVVIDSYKAKDIIDFAPRATVAGNSSMMSDLTLYQPLLQTDWQHGMGFHWYSDAEGYMTTTGNIDTRHDGLVMMYTKSSLERTDLSPVSGMVAFDGDMYFYGSFGLYRLSGTTWTEIYITAKVNYAINAGDYLLFCPDGIRVKKMAKTTLAVTDAGLDASSIDYKWLIINSGFIYAGVDGTNRIHFDTNADLSQLEGTSADPDKILAGIGNMTANGAVVYGGSLYVSRPDGLWQIGEDKIARRVIDYTDSISPNNFLSMTVVNGYLMFPIRDRVVQWNGSRTSDITPSRITDEFPYVSYVQFRNFVNADNFLFCTARTNETLYTESLLCFDGVGWHKLTDLYVGDAHQVEMMGYEAINNRLWYSVNGSLYYIPMETSSFPYANFPTTGQHSLITSRLDMGFRRITKSADALYMETRNLTKDRYINVYYSLDGEDYILWEKVDQNGISILKYPGGYQTMEFNYAILRFDFVTDDAEQTPVLESYTLSFIMRPVTRMGYTFQIVAATNYENDMYSDDRTSAEILRELREIRNSKSPVKFVGLLGDEILGYLTSIGESVARRTETDVEYLTQCSFVEL